MGVSENYIVIYSTLLMISVVAFSVTVNTVPLNCRHVRRDFNTWLPMKHDPHFPRRPFHDSKMRICYNPRQVGAQKSCCSSQMEKQYMLDGNTQIRKLISLRNFQKILKSKRTAFEKEERYFHKALVRYMMHFLTAKFKFPRPSMRELVDDFFSQLLSNSTRPGESVVVENFVIQLSPLLYYYTMKHGAENLFIQRRHDCLAESFRRRSRSKFAPPPDGNLLFQLKRAKVAHQRLRRSLEMVMLVLQRLEQLEYPNECLEAMARNHLCPKCFGTSNSSSVCLLTCQNVFQGCHMHWADLQAAWNRYMDGMKALTDFLVERWNLGPPVEKLIEFVVKTLGGVVLGEVKRLDPDLIRDCFVEGHRIEPVSQRATTTGPTPKFPLYMVDNLRAFSSLTKSKVNFFTRLVRKPCQKLPRKDCWNGTHLSATGYTRKVDDLFGQTQEENPEVTRQSAEQKETVALLKRQLESDRAKMILKMRKLSPQAQPTPPKKKRRQEKNKRGKNKRRQRQPFEGSGSAQLPEGSGEKEKHKPPDDEEPGVSGSGDYIEPNPIRKVPVPRNITSRWRPQTTSTTVITYRNQPPERRRVIATETVTVRSAASVSSPVIGVRLLILLPIVTVVSW